MLEIRVQNPTHPQDGTPVLVLMHGRGADPSDLEGFRPWLPDDLTVVLPRAPFPGHPWGYGPGWAWYRYLGDDRPEEESFRTSQRELDALLSELPRQLGYEPGPLLVGGFSQGGTMAMGCGIRRPGLISGVLNLSGFLPHHPDVTVTRESVQGTRFFWGHGTEDPAVPFELARRGRKALEEAGADLKSCDYPTGHAIMRQEMEDVAAWVREVCGADRRAGEAT